jgi:SET domain-containing protein
MKDFLVKDKSSIHGTGIFTKREILKKLLFYEIPVGLIFDKPKAGCAYIGKNRWVSDPKILNYINHSCDPNSILDISCAPKLIAKRDIKVGEEITVNYNETETNGKKVSCYCKTPKCRKYFLRKE